MRCTTLSLWQQSVEPNQFFQAQMGLVCFMLLPWMDGFLSLVMSTIEMRWSHLRGCLGNTCSLPKMYDRKLPSFWLTSHLLPPPAPALAVKGPLPARRGRLLLLELPGPLTGTPSINRDCKLSKWGPGYHRKIQNKRQHLILHAPRSPSSENAFNLTWQIGKRFP